MNTKQMRGLTSSIRRAVRAGATVPTTDDAFRAWHATRFGCPHRAVEYNEAFPASFRKNLLLRGA